jgi:hypothetical protein
MKNNPEGAQNSIKRKIQPGFSGWIFLMGLLKTFK